MPSNLPGCYSQSELAAIEASLTSRKLTWYDLKQLQISVGAFQSARLEETRRGAAAKNRSRRRRLKQLLTYIIKLCEERAPETEIKLLFNDSDGLVLQVLRPIEEFDHFKIKTAALCALATLSKPGPKSKNARRQFVDVLAGFFERTTGKKAGSSVDGPFSRFVVAALNPFKETQGIDRVIKIVVAERKAHHS